MRLVTLLVPLFLAATASAQEMPKVDASGSASALLAVSHFRSLSVSSTPRRTQLLGPVFNRISCDTEGNLYARRFEAGAKGAEPVEKIATTGALVRSFKPDSPTLTFSISDFFVGSQSELYMLAWSREQVYSGGRVYVIQFGSDGSVKSQTQISSEDFFPTNLAVFQSGEFLITGTKGREDSAPFTAVFDPNGKMIAQVYEPEDEDLRTKAEERDPSVHDAGLYGNIAVSLGGVVRGSDGNAYLMRRTSPALIFVISPKGQVIRKLRIDPGDSTSLPEQMQASESRLAVSFVAPGGPSLLKVVDYTGKDIATYQVSKTVLAGSLGCYNPPVVTWLNRNGAYMEIEELVDK